MTIGEAHLVVTASIGIVVTQDATAAPAMLLRDADNAMYDAKRSGRDQIVLYHEQRARRRQPQVGPQSHPRLAAQRKLSSRR